MSLSKIHSIALIGLDAVQVEIEIDTSKGNPEREKGYFVIVGLPDAAVKESKDRVQAALKNSLFSIHSIDCIVNLAPGNLRKEGVLYDLPIALGILLALDKLPKNANTDDYLIVGELSLSGHTRPVFGALAIAMLAKQLGKKGVLLPSANAQEASCVPGVKIIPIDTIKDAVHFFANNEQIDAVSSDISSAVFSHTTASIDFSDIKGQAHVKRAMEIAAAGGHNAVLCGPPGAGKTMLAKALIGIMPPLTFDEALETTKIYSIAGLLIDGQHLITQRPFRSPHHTVSYAGLIGGGTYPRPGEVSLAHNGILFLDELPEFSRSVLEVLRQPLEDRKVTISRANGNLCFPTSFICIAAMNPCPCGYLGHPDKPCQDSPLQVNRYRNRISGPLWDRMDMHIEVNALRYREIITEPSSESSQTVRERVIQARTLQYERYKSNKTNSLMSHQELKKLCSLDSECQSLLQHAIDTLGFSARACIRILRVALTIADLAGSKKVSKEHVLEAINFRDIRR